VKYLNLTFADPASNLACDEAMLEMFETLESEDGLLRLWEATNYFVVLGYSSRILSEVNVAVCESEAIPILRRVSGGGTVVQGPGCLNYSLILRGDTFDLTNIRESFHFVLRRHRECIAQLAGVRVDIEGISDLAIDGRKFSGNAQYRKRRFVLLHGTFLLNFAFSFVDRCLPLPTKQPGYRRQRTHLEFLANLHLQSQIVREAVKAVWNASREFSAVPVDKIKDLVRDRYSRQDWTWKF
jgi:lipoate-protein ligase A